MLSRLGGLRRDKRQEEIKKGHKLEGGGKGLNYIERRSVPVLIRERHAGGHFYRKKKTGGGKRKEGRGVLIHHVSGTVTLIKGGISSQTGK